MFASFADRISQVQPGVSGGRTRGSMYQSLTEHLTEGGALLLVMLCVSVCVWSLCVVHRGVTWVRTASRWPSRGPRRPVASSPPTHSSVCCVSSSSSASSSSGLATALHLHTRLSLSQPTIPPSHPPTHRRSVLFIMIRALRGRSTSSQPRALTFCLVVFRLLKCPAGMNDREGWQVCALPQ
jgi:hypothetical protein